jgi:hypothetical protein
VNLAPTQLYRLVGVGLSNFEAPAKEPAAEPELFETE